MSHCYVQKTKKKKKMKTRYEFQKGQLKAITIVCLLVGNCSQLYGFRHYFFLKHRVRAFVVKNEDTYDFVSAYTVILDSLLARLSLRIRLRQSQLHPFIIDSHCKCRENNELRGHSVHSHHSPHPTLISPVTYFLDLFPFTHIF